MHTSPLPVSLHLHSVPATFLSRKTYFKVWFLWPLCSWAAGITTYTNWNRAIDPVMALGSSLGPTRQQQCPCITTGHPDQHGPGNSMALRQQHSLRWLTRVWAFSDPWVIAGVTVTLRVTEPNMTLGRSLALDISKAPSISYSHPDQYVPSNSMVLGQQCSLRSSTECHASTEASVLMGAVDINSDLGLCSHEPRPSP